MHRMLRIAQAKVRPATLILLTCVRKGRKSAKFTSYYVCALCRVFCVLASCGILRDFTVGQEGSGYFYTYTTGALVRPQSIVGTYGG